jgi:predicted nucleic acid-binding protein
VILVDTSVWIDHFRRANAVLASALGDGQVGTHPFILGELALGSIPGRNETLALLQTLPSLTPSPHDEVMAFVTRHRLAGSGLGWVDVHVLCAARRERWSLWSSDRRLRSAAADLRT